MMWTITAPRSTSTHSPFCSPSTPCIAAPSPFSFSWTRLESALLWRDESALAMMTLSNSDVIFFTSRTTMSRALTSSSAATVAFTSLSILIDLQFKSVNRRTSRFTHGKLLRGASGVEPSRLNIIEYRVGKQITRAPSRANALADHRRGNVERRYRNDRDAARGREMHG